MTIAPDFLESCQKKLKKAFRLRMRRKLKMKTDRVFRETYLMVRGSPLLFHSYVLRYAKYLVVERTWRLSIFQIAGWIRSDRPHHKMFPVENRTKDLLTTNLTLHRLLI